MDNVDGTVSQLSKRDVLKLGVASLIAAALPPPTDKISTENILKINTNNANYYPIYEVHETPVSQDDLSKLPNLDILMYEYQVNAAKPINDSADEILRYPSSKRERAIPPDHAKFLQKNGTELVLEGYYLGPTLKGVSVFSKFAGPSAIFINESIKKIKSWLNEDEPVQKRTSLSNLTKLIYAWLASTWIPLAAKPFDSKSTIIQSSEERIVTRIIGIASHIHPEDPSVFFRDLMIARRLQVIANFKNGEKLSKPKIGYNVGKLHTGIEDLLYCSEDFILGLISSYGSMFWNELCKINGGAKNLASCILLTPSGFGFEKRIILDKQLYKLISAQIKS